MIFDCDRVPVIRVADLLQEASANTGFSRSDIETLVDCELDTFHVLEYINAVLSNRMN